MFDFVDVLLRCLIVFGRVVVDICVFFRLLMVFDVFLMVFDCVSMFGCAFQGRTR